MLRLGILLGIERPPTHVLNTRYISDGKRDRSTHSLSKQYLYVKNKEHITTLRLLEDLDLSPPSTIFCVVQQIEGAKQAVLVLRRNAWRCRQTRGKLS